MPQVFEKEKHLTTAYGIILYKNNHPDLKALKQDYQPSIHGHKTWDSSFLLMDYLLHQRLLKTKMRVMELGCGWGPASIFCAENADCKVQAIDMDSSVFPFLESQAAINDVQIQTIESSFEQLSNQQLKQNKLIIGADICFWDNLTDIHFSLIKKALKQGVQDIIYADPGRAPFYELAERCIKHFNAEHYEWYATEPKKFEGYILHIKNNS